MVSYLHMKDTLRLPSGYSADFKCSKEVSWPGILRGELSTFLTTIKTPDGKPCGVVRGVVLEDSDTMDLDFSDHVLTEMASDLNDECMLEETSVVLVERVYMNKDHRGNGVGFTAMKETLKLINSFFKADYYVWRAVPLDDKGKLIKKPAPETKTALENAIIRQFPGVDTKVINRNSYMILDRDKLSPKSPSNKSKKSATSDIRSQYAGPKKQRKNFKLVHGYCADFKIECAQDDDDGNESIFSFITTVKSPNNIKCGSVEGFFLENANVLECDYVCGDLSTLASNLLAIRQLDNRIIYIASVSMDSAHRGKGVGFEALRQTIRNLTTSRGAGFAIWTTDSDNSPKTTQGITDAYCRHFPGIIKIKLNGIIYLVLEFHESEEGETAFSSFIKKELALSE